MTYSWAILLFFYELPRWLLFLSSSEIMVVFAYAMALAFLDSLACLASVLVPGLFFYKRVLQNAFVAVMGAMGLSGYVWVGVLRFLHLRSLASGTNWLAESFPTWLVLALGTTLLAGMAAHRYAPLRKGVVSIAEKAQVFLYLYLPASLICILVVIFRNWI